KYVLSAGKQIRLRSEEVISFEVGESSLEIRADKIVLKSHAIEILGKEEAMLTGPGPSLRLTKEAEIVAASLSVSTERASLQLDKNASLRGEQIRLNCDEAQPKPVEGSDKAPEMQDFGIKLTDEDFKPYAGKRYRMSAEGLRFDGKTEADGIV